MKIAVPFWMALLCFSGPAWQREPKSPEAVRRAGRREREEESGKRTRELKTKAGLCMMSFN